MGFHFNINRDEFLKAIGAQQNITGKKGTMAILANVLMEVNQEGITLTATDLEIGLKKFVLAEVFATGVLALPSKKLFELVRESSAPVLSFREEENNWVEIHAGSSLYRLAGMVGDDYPEFPEYNEDGLVTVKGDILADLIEKTIFSISTDLENAYNLSGALFLKESGGENNNVLKMVSSDGHRLSIMGREVDDSVENLTLNPITLIPRKGIQEMRKFCDEHESFLLGVEEKQAVLKSDDSLLIIRLIEGEFPDYQGILDIIARDNIIKIKRSAFLESLKRINLFTENEFHAIKMEITDNKLVLMSQNADFGSAKDEIDVEYTGEPLYLGFNCRYFIDTLQVMEADIISAAISSADSPCLISSEEDAGFLSIIMPMQI